MRRLGRTLATVALLIAVQNITGQEIDQDRAGNERLAFRGEPQFGAKRKLRE